MNISNNYKYFSNTQCEYYPCHKLRGDYFNCLFCYCPLYALGENCGGGFIYRENGIKSCENCSFPHRRENYDKLIARFSELAKLAARERKKD